MELRRGDGPPLVIGHRGAAAVAPENTLASLAAAVAAGADLVEFDLGAGLVLAHSADEVPEQPLSLDEALKFLAPHPIGVLVDLKVSGIEAEIAAVLRRHAFADRAVVSTVSAASLRRFAAIAPEVGRAITYPHDRHGISGFRWPRVLTATGAGALRAVMPLRVAPLVWAARANAVSLHQALVSRATVLSAHAVGAPVLAWTANEPAVIERLAALGVDAIISDHPELTRRTLARLALP